MNTPEPIEAETTVLTVRDPEQQAVADVALAEKHIQLTPAQARVESVADVLAKARAQASLLKLTPEEVKLLKADFPDEAFKMGAGGDPNLIYIEHAFLRDRFDEAIGMCQWSLIRSRPHWAEEYTTSKGEKAVRIYADCALVIRGSLVAEAIGEMSYFPNNAKTNYGDAVEGSETAAFRRCAKKIGVGLQAWKKDFGDGWKQRQRTVGRPAQQPTQPEFAGTKTTTPQRPASSPPAQSGSLQSKDDTKRIEALLEESKKKLLASLQPDLLRLTWIYALRCGMLMPNERLEAVNAHLFFPNAAKMTHYETAVKAIRGDYDAAMSDIKQLQGTANEQRDFDAIYGNPGTNTDEPEQPLGNVARVPTTCPKCKSTATKTSKDYDLVSWCEKCGWQWGEGGKAYEEYPWALVISPIPPKGMTKKDYDQSPLTLGQIMRTDSKRFYGLIMNNQEAKGWTDRSGNQRPPSEADRRFADACRAAAEHLDSKKSGAVDAMRQGVETDEPPF